MWCPVEVNLDWTIEISSFLMRFLEITTLHKFFFLGQTYFIKLFVELCFLKKYCIVTLS